MLEIPSRRRTFLKRSSTAAVGLVGFSTHRADALVPDPTISAVTDPIEAESNNDDFVTCGPDDCGLQGQQTWFNHRGTVEYYGVAARPQPTGTDKWGHVLRIGGRGETVTAYNGDDPKTDGDYFPYLTGHGVDFPFSDDGTLITGPIEEHHDGKLGAAPAEDNRMLDTTERAENLFQVLLGQTPGLGGLSTLNTVVNNLIVSEGAGSDDFGWMLDSISGIDYEHTSVTDHFVEFEALSVPGDDVQLQADTKSYLTFKVEAESPIGLRAHADLVTPDDEVPTSTQEALDYGYDAKLHPDVTGKYDQGEVTASDVDVRDVIAPPPGGDGVDLVTLP